MTLFEDEVKKSLNLIEYRYSDGQYIISDDQLFSLIENVALAVVYKQDLRNEIYLENN